MTTGQTIAIMHLQEIAKDPNEVSDVSSEVKLNLDWQINANPKTCQAKLQLINTMRLSIHDFNVPRTETAEQAKVL